MPILLYLISIQSQYSVDHGVISLNTYSNKCHHFQTLTKHVSFTQPSYKCGQYVIPSLVQKYENNKDTMTETIVNSDRTCSCCLFHYNI